MTDEQKPGQAPDTEQTHELSAYEKLVQQTKAHLARMTSAIDAEEFRKTIDKSADEMRKIGDHSRDAINKAAEALKKDLATTTEHMKILGKSTGHAVETMQHAGTELWSHLARGTGNTWETWRDWSASTAAEFMRNVSAWSAKAGEHLGESLVYHTGDMTYGGKFKCDACGTEVSLDKPGHIPPCPNCAKTEFKRS